MDTNNSYGIANWLELNHVVCDSFRPFLVEMVICGPRFGAFFVISFKNQFWLLNAVFCFVWFQEVKFCQIFDFSFVSKLGGHV